MDIRRVPRAAIDDAQWDRLISHSRQGVLYAFSWYLDRVCERWEALVVGGSTGYSLVMPIPLRRKWGHWVVSQPYFCQYLGVFAQEAIAADVLKQFVSAMVRHYSYISSYSFSPYHGAALASEKGRSLLVGNVELEHTHWLRIAEGSSGRLYTADRRRNLRSANRYGWSIVDSTDMNPLIELFKKYHAPTIGVHPRAYESLRRIVSLAKVRVSIQYACLAGQIHAGILIVESMGHAIYLFNASDTVGRRGNARTLLIDRYLQRNSKDLKLFDFESPPIASISSFYASFAAEAVPIIKISNNRMSFPIPTLMRWRRAFYWNLRSVFKPL
ncbi:hypothetical protein CLV98_104382 [Dyadobacter jejuensis]|uniref:Acetyltransferase (GNAT) family protein n=1 Tax=Dyadobacter jejuensis TaxID=1082580 RepID=A0A316ALW4_9BACT|nr:hypothetical protein [Dyadobacter jejuensis]PWJ58522.1 hypothetical protein CLV98_104382 [Dyadobacter jejuensis]